MLVGKKGTVIQLQVRFHRKNLKTNVIAAVNADRKSLNLITYRYAVLAAMEYLKLQDKDEKPANFHEGMDKVAYFNMVAYVIVDKYILKFKSPADILQPIQELKQPLVEHKGTSKLILFTHLAATIISQYLQFHKGRFITPMSFMDLKNGRL